MARAPRSRARVCHGETEALALGARNVQTDGAPDAATAVAVLDGVHEDLAALEEVGPFLLEALDEACVGVEAVAGGVEVGARLRERGLVPVRERR